MMIESERAASIRGETRDASVGPLLNKLFAECNSKKVFRIIHQRQDGIHSPVVLQNRTIEAESAQQALELARHSPEAKASSVPLGPESLAIIERSASSDGYVDIWCVEVEHQD